MFRYAWRQGWRKLFPAIVASIAAGAFSGAAYGQEVDVTEVLRRIERLEQKNQELLSKVNASPVAAEAQGGAVDTKTVETIVGSYLKKQDAEKKKAEDAKAKEFAPVGGDLNMKAKWNNGLTLETPLKDFKVHVGGRVHFDIGAFDPEADPMPEFLDAASFRRARLRVDGTCWEVVNWVVEFDFASPDNTNQTAVFTDVFMEITQLPVVGTFRAGHFKEPFSLEEMTGDNFVTFMERSLLSQAFVPSRHLGFMVQRNFANERIYGAAGVFRTNGAGNRGFDNGDGEYSVTTRLTGLPIWAEDGRCLMHIGGAYSHRSYNPQDGPTPVYQSRMPFRLGTPILVNASGGDVLGTATGVQLVGGEFAFVRGPFSIQSEVVGTYVHSDADNPTYWGGYAQVSYFLTGESRTYNRKIGAFDRQKVIEPYFFTRGEDGRNLLGRGAWEIAARYTYLDLREGDVVVPTATNKSGGTGILQDMTFALNWYLNPNFRITANYARAWRDSDTANRSGFVDGVGVRFIIDF